MLEASKANAQSGSTKGAHDTVDTSDREIVLTRVFKAPREMVFEAWSKPEHLAKWWGPNGFTITTTRFEFKAGGEWHLVMHGPDGVDYPNTHVFVEIVKNEKIVHRHRGEIDGVRADFEMTVTFTQRGDHTELTLRQVHSSKEARDVLAKKYGAIEGAKQTLARLGEHLGVMSAEVDAPSAGGAAPELRLTRVFNAPRHLVWDAWTKPEHLKQWWGPRMFTTPSCKIELRKGGAFDFSMRGPDGKDYPFKGTIDDVIVPERLAFTGLIHDENKSHTVVTFTEHDGKTTVDLVQTYTRESFATRGAKEGWSQSLDKLGEMLAKYA